MNIDINRDIVVRFDEDGRPLNYWGEIIFTNDGKRMLKFSKEVLDNLNRARELIEESKRW